MRKNKFIALLPDQPVFMQTYKSSHQHFYSPVDKTTDSCTESHLVQKSESEVLLMEGQGPVVQSIVSLTSSLRGQLIKCIRLL